MKNDSKQILDSVHLPKEIEQIAKMSVFIAKNAIDDTAHRTGDSLVKEILECLSPVKIAAILRQHDFSNPSIISWLLSPRVIVNVLKIDPLFWKNIYDETKSDNFLQIQNEALNLIVSILENVNDRNQQGEILRKISCDNLSLLYLIIPFIGWKIKKEQTLFIEDPDIDFGTPDHLFEMIRWAAPQVAEQIFNSVYSTPLSIIYYITDLWTEAFDCFDKEYEYKSVEAIMFMPID